MDNMTYMDNATYCYSDAYDTVIKAGKQLGAVSEEQNARLANICSNLDSLMTELETISYSTAVDEQNKLLRISLFCDDVVLKSELFALFLSLTKESAVFSFAKSDNGGVRMDFGVAGLWGDK